MLPHLHTSYHCHESFIMLFLYCQNFLFIYMFMRYFRLQSIRSQESPGNGHEYKPIVKWSDVKFYLLAAENTKHFGLTALSMAGQAYTRGNFNLPHKRDIVQGSATKCSEHKTFWTSLPSYIALRVSCQLFWHFLWVSASVFGDFFKNWMGWS